MSTISVDYDVLNQKGSPAWYSDLFANIPTAGYKGRMFISIDTYAFYRDTGTGWDLIGGPGTGTLTGSGTTGQVSFFNGSSTLAGSNNLFWDITNSRLGIGTTTPGASLDIHSTGTNAQFNGTGTNNAYLIFQNAGTSKWRIGNTYNAGANSFDIYNNGLASTPFSINSTTNAITLISNLIGTTANFTNYVVVGIPSYTGAKLNVQDVQSTYLLDLINGTEGEWKLRFYNNGTATIPGLSFTQGLYYNLIENGAVKFYRGNTFNDGSLALSTAGVDRINISTGGFIGIGNTNITYNLDITGTLRNTTSSYFATSSGSVGIGNVSASYKLDITGDLRNTTSAYFSTASGNTGIGTTNPSAYGYFGVVGTATITSLTGVVAGFSDNVNGTTRLYVQSGINGISVDQSFAISTGGGSPIERARITSAGYFLIGTTASTGIGTSRLQVAGTGTTSQILATNTGGGYSSIYTTSLDVYYTRIDTAGSTLFIGTGPLNGSSFNEQMKITSTGVVTITNIGTGAVTATAGVLSTTSDMNLKIEDGYIDNALDKVLKLKPRYFYWKEESGLPTYIRQLGFYAQEVNEAIGEEGANTPKKENEKWGIYDRAIIAMITKAIQELNEKLIRNNIN